MIYLSLASLPNHRPESMKTITLEISSVTLNFLKEEKEGKMKTGEEDYIQYLRWIWFNSSEVWSSVDLRINVNDDDQKKSYI